MHGDLGLDNVLFLPGDHPVVVDWAHCGRGAGVLDLGAVLFGIAPLDRFADIVDRYVVALRDLGLRGVDDRDVLRWLNGAMIHEFVTRTLGVVRWAAGTERGERVLERWMARTPQVVDAWHELDPAVLETGE